jgi:PhnB protein
MKKAAKKKVAPIPKGYSALTPHLTVKGATQAIDFYTKAFGAKMRMRMELPGGLVMHGEMQIGPCAFMLADETPGCMTPSPSTLNGTTASLYLYVKDVDAAYAKAVAAGATGMMPPTDMFYGDRMCSLKDPFGHFWSLATHVEDVSPKEMAKRSKEFMQKMAAGKPAQA